MSEATAIRCERVGKEFVSDWRGRVWRALGEVTCAVPRGSLCALVGPNGAGKSTLLRVCSGLTAPTSGVCKVLGEQPTMLLRRGKIGFMPENANLPSGLGVETALCLLAGIAGMNERAAAEAVSRVLRETRLTDLRQRKIGELSNGQRRRLGLAQALLRGPEVLLLDEPAAGLDPRAVLEMTALLQRQRETGATVVLSSHFLPEIETLCDHFIVLDRGRVVFEGEVESVRAAGGLTKIFVSHTQS